jgi:hypothetical protein
MAPAPVTKTEMTDPGSAGLVELFPALSAACSAAPCMKALVTFLVPLANSPTNSCGVSKPIVRYVNQLFRLR